MLTGLLHSAICVPDVDAAVEWYTTVLGMRELSPPYRAEGDAITADMGELVPAPVVVKAAMVGFEDSDRVLELLEYPEVQGPPKTKSSALIDVGPSHIGLLCDDLAATRRELEKRGVEFLTEGIADIYNLRTTWFRDPWGTVFIILEKGRPDRPYWRQY